MPVLSMPGNATTHEVDTSWGTIRVTADDGKVTGCILSRLDTMPAVPFSAEVYGHDRIARFVVGTLAGRKRKVPALGNLIGTDFQHKVWDAIASIQFGETMSYTELAKTIGRSTACRAVANACGANPVPLFIPCHRVVGANGALGGFSAGLAWKRLLLAAEGYQSN
ncbi:MAG: methylated-DNA--[protein]-cysteine S-methyltransferase [Pontiella sp.]|nr:methylated-DNA--[protein]-cysteine S-methyltransferase [Pontiella sp.]